MKIYELIQELCNYDADCEVEISCELKDVEVSVMVDNEEKEVAVNFEDTTDVEVSSTKSYYGSKKEKVILSAYFS